MNTKKITVWATLLVALFFSATFALAEPIFGPENAVRRVDGVDVGRLGKIPAEGWSAGIAKPSTQDRSNLFYLDLEAVRLMPEKGSVAFEVVRDEVPFPNAWHDEVLFHFSDSNWRPIFGASFLWRSSGSSIDLFQNVQLSTQNFNLGPVSRGGRFTLSFAWENEVLSVFQDGQKLGVFNDLNGNTMSGLFEKSRYLVVGTYYDSAFSLAGGLNHLNSKILNMRVFDTIETYPEFVPPQKVAGIIGEPTPDVEIKVSWNASASSDVANYLLYRAENGTIDYNAPYFQKTRNLEYIDTHVIPGIKYTYSVVAVDRMGNRSEPSEVVSVLAVPGGNGPSISAIGLDPLNKPMRPGQSVTFTMKGQMNSKAQVEIEGLGKVVDLVYTGKNGLYSGTLSLDDSDIADTTFRYQIVGRMTDDYGTSLLAGPQLIVVGRDVLSDVTPPSISSLNHDGSRVAGFSGKLVSGDLLTVRLEGEKEGFGSFRLVGVTAQQAMNEIEPGVYEGTYTIGWLDEGAEVAVEAALSDMAGNETTTVSSRTLDIDTRVRVSVTANDTMLPADKESKTRVLVKATNANGDEVQGHELMLKLTTTDEYTGVVGGGKVMNKFASKDDEDDIEVKWGGITDSFGEIAATYTAGFAAKTALIVAKDLTSGDIGAGWLNTYVASTVAIQLLPTNARDAASLPVIKLSVTPGWLTADGRSKARVKAWITEQNGTPVKGAKMKFELAADNGSIKTLRGITDDSGMAEADYRAGTVTGMVTIIATCPEERVSSSIQIELKSDAPAKIGLVSSAVSLPADGRSVSNLRAVVTDINNNPNKQVPIAFSMVDGSGGVTADKALTDDKGVVTAVYTAGRTPGTAVVEARHTSRPPNESELRRVYGTIFVPRLKENMERDRIKVEDWYAKPGELVEKGQALVKISVRDQSWTLFAAEKGTFKKQVRYKRDVAEMGDTLGYIEIDEDVWNKEYK